MCLQQKSPLFVVGGRQLAGEEQKADTLVPAPVTSESANYSTSATSFGKDPSPLSALPLVDEIMMSLNEEDKKALGGTAPADGSLSSQATSTFKSGTSSSIVCHGALRYVPYIVPDVSYLRCGESCYVL